MRNVIAHAQNDFINMIIKNRIWNLIIKFLPVIIVISGILLLVHEIYQFNNLPSKYDDNSYSDYLKYKEDTYCQLFLWSLLLFTGIISLIYAKLKWIVYQILLTKLLISSLLLIFVEYTSMEIKILSGVFLVGLIIVEIWLYKQNVISKFKINTVKILSSIIIGVISAAIYWTIRLNF